MSRSATRPFLTPLARLDAGLAYRLVLIIAPQGAGKTEFLQTWVNQRMENGDPAPAWVRLGKLDNSLEIFLGHLINTFSAIDTRLESALKPLRRAEKYINTQDNSPTPSEIGLFNSNDLLIDFINALADLPREFILILDEYHLIESPEVHQVVSFLIDYLPKNLHIYLATRSLPPLRIAHLRARREMIEIGPGELSNSFGHNLSK